MRCRRLALNLSLTLVLVAVAAGAVTAATATATITRTISVASGGTTATLHYRSSPAGSDREPYSKLRLSIARHGVTLLERPVDAILCGRLCWPNVGIPASPVLRIADVEHNGSPDVILNLFSGGAHCCAITQVYRYDPATKTYSIVQHDFADPGYYLRASGGGAYLFVSADDRFAYAFASFAFSGLPAEIWSFATGGFVDVTRRYPAAVAADAARQYHDYLANRGQGLGLGYIAAWAADEDLLGHKALVARTLAAQNRAGELRSGDGLAQHGRAFISQLQRFLVKSGYAT
jgi:hypothetical protein